MARSAEQSFHHSGVTVARRRNFRKLPGEIMNLPIHLLAWVIILAFGWIPLVPESVLSVLTTAFFYGSMATAWNLHSLSGAISLGHAAFFGLGAYGFAIAASKYGISSWAGMLIGALCAVVYALFWMISINRLRHGSFVLATLVSVEIPRVIIENLDSFTHGSAGIMNLRIPVGIREWYIIMVILAGLLLLIHHQTLFSRLGWGLRAVRDDERTAMAVGVPVEFLRRCTLIVSSFFMGLCGAFYAAMIGLVEPSIVFSLHFSAMPLVLSLFGGREHLYGPLIGGLILYNLDQLLMVPLFPEAHRALYGIAIFVTIWFFPKGILAWTKRP
jgi:branched-chain amino acid transport system permease protein